MGCDLCAIARMEKIIQDLSEFLPTLAVALIILLVGILLTVIITRIAKKAMGRSKIDPSLASFFIRLIRVVCYVLIAIAFLSKLGVSTTGLIAFFSAALAAVALALKDNIADIASGIVILFTEFGAFKGYVTKIDMIHTKPRTYDDT